LARTSWETASFSADVLASFLHATNVMAVIQTTAKGITIFFMCVFSFDLIVKKKVGLI
jgi:hypothetical protein